MTEFELRILLIETSGTISDQFQFWMAATFAVVIASYTAGHRLALWARVSIAVLYAAAVALFYLRYLYAVDELLRLSAQLREISVEQDFVRSLPAPAAGILRQLVMLGGSILALILICKPTIGNAVSSDQDDA